MNVQAAAVSTLEFVKVEPIQNTTGTGPQHAAWMLRGIAEGYIQYEKAHRWLGYAQSILVVEKFASLGDMKKVNKKS